MVRISIKTDHFWSKVFPNLKEQLKLGQMEDDVSKFIRQISLLSLVFGVNVGVLAFIVLSKTSSILYVFPVLILAFILFFLMFLQIPKVNNTKIRTEIEGDIFTPARMFLTLLESGNSIISALERVSYTNAKSSKYFGKIASQIYLGKTIDEAIDDAIKYTPSDSFRRVLQPIRKSLRTGTDIQKNLAATLEDLAKEKVIEIERYEKRLGAISLFYMIFGVIVPAISVIVLVVGMSVIGLKIDFFPFLFILLLVTLIVQAVFIRIFNAIRPLMRI